MGKSPFRIGLWVRKKNTPNTTKQSTESVKQAHSQHERKWASSQASGVGSPHQLTFCPWCGSKIERGKQHVVVEEFSQGAGRTFTYYGKPTEHRAATPSRSLE